MFKTICYFVLLYLENPKNVCNCSRLISVGSCYLLYILALYVFTVSSCGWVRNGVENLKDPVLRSNINLSFIATNILPSILYIIYALYLDSHCCYVALLS
jgi:hypothetical protein